jgi:hypothetical protein
MEDLFIIERQLRAKMPASTLESNLTTTRGQMLDLVLDGRSIWARRRRARWRTARDGGTRERPDARDNTASAVCVCARRTRGRVASGQISRACGTRQPLETGPLCQPASFQYDLRNYGPNSSTGFLKAGFKGIKSYRTGSRTYGCACGRVAVPPGRTRERREHMAVPPL